MGAPNPKYERVAERGCWTVYYGDYAQAYKYPEDVEAYQCATATSVWRADMNRQPLWSGDFAEMNARNYAEELRQELREKFRDMARAREMEVVCLLERMGMEWECPVPPGAPGYEGIKVRIGGRVASLTAQWGDIEIGDELDTNPPSFDWEHGNPIGLSEEDAEAALRSLM